MNVDSWLESAVADARQRSRDDVVAVLDVLAGAIATLRGAAWNRPIEDHDEPQAPDV